MISINDRNYDFTPGMGLMDLLRLDNVDIHDATLIVLNDVLVKKDLYEETTLKDGDRILAIRVSTGG